MGASATGRLPIDLLDHDLFADHEPWEVFDLLQREAPVYFHPEPDGRGFWALTKYDDVQAVVRDAKTFSSEVGGSATIEDLPEDVLAVRRNFLEFDPPKHGRYRRLMSTSFTPGAVAKYEDWLRELISGLLDRVQSGVQFDLVDELAAPIPIRVLAHVMGLPDADLPHLIALGDRLLVDTDPDYVGDLAFGRERDEDRFKPFGSPWAEELCAIGRSYYADRRGCPRQDLLTLLANAEVDDKPLSGHDLDNTFALLIVAGNETTRQGIALGTLALAQNPEQYARVRAQPELIGSAVEEMLRYASPVWWFRRTATRAVQIRGQEIAAGDKVVVWFAAANRDPDHYPDPHRFDVTRNPTDQLTFGRGGPHHCLGVHLARLETRVYLEELVRRVPVIELAGAPVRHRSNFTNGLKRLPVRMTFSA
ncbi:MAG TPA: cytochrome P450 [Solirubrobacteraceae bacterium]|nr:cytochrome P450 [Solirubrobacteraceae bacterium]